MKKQSDLLGKALMLMISSVFIFMGTINVLTQHYYGETTRRGFKEVILNGGPAVIMGVFLIFMGLIPMAILFKNKTHLKIWLTFCVVGLISALLLLLSRVIIS